jgi:hypothetical protein
MIVETYKGVEIEECQLYNEINDFYGGGMEAYDCCAEPTLDPELQDMVCARGGEMAELFAMTDIVLKLDYKYYNRAMTWNEVTSAIDNGFLIMSLISQPLFGNGHAHIISGYVERDGKHYLIISETTLGQVIEIEYEVYLGRGMGVFEAAMVFTMEPTVEPTCSMVFGELVCKANVQSESLLSRILRFFSL